MSTDEKYSCPAEFWAEFVMYIGVTITLFSLFHHRYLLPVLDAALLALMSYLLSVETQSNLEGRAQLILIWMVLFEVNRVGYNNPLKSWELGKTLEQIFRLVWVGYQLISTGTPIQGIRVSLYLLGIYFFVYEIMKAIVYNKRLNSCQMGKNPTLINNYVKRYDGYDLQTKPIDSSRPNPTPIDSCDYTVVGEENYEINGYIVTGEQNYEIEDSSHGPILALGKKKCNSGPILTISEVSNSKLPRETCISFALAKMLMRRFAKIPADEAGSEKGASALDSVLKVLTGEIGGYGDTQTDRNKGKSNKIERVFRIIEEELKIVDDILEAKIQTYYYFPWYAIIVVIGILLVLADGIYLIVTITKRSYAWLSLRRLEVYKQCFLDLFANGSEGVKILSRFDRSITIILVLACIFSLSRESIAIVTPWVESNRWYYHKSIEKYLENPANWGSRCYSSEAPSEKELPQAHGKNAKKDRKYSSVLDPSILPKCIKRKFPKSFFRPFVSADVKEAILFSLEKSKGQLPNGETYLKEYGMEHLNCQPNGSNTEAILVWHIATTLLPQNNDPNQESAPQQDNKPFTKEVALSLSSYCHYLVSDLPELLPDDVKWTKKMYGNVRKDTLSIPWFSDRCKYTLDATWDEGSLVSRGVNLAKELMNCAKEGTDVWTMLAHFWAEMMLFIAPSDNVKGHAKYLHLNPKELIIQLWALLTHVGIITRPKPTKHQKECFHGITRYPKRSAI